MNAIKYFEQIGPYRFYSIFFQTDSEITCIIYRISSFLFVERSLFVHGKKTGKLMTALEKPDVKPLTDYVSKRGTRGGKTKKQSVTEYVIISPRQRLL